MGALEGSAEDHGAAAATPPDGHEAAESGRSPSKTWVYDEATQPGVEVAPRQSAVPSRPLRFAHLLQGSMYEGVEAAAIRRQPQAATPADAWERVDELDAPWSLKVSSPARPAIARPSNEVVAPTDGGMGTAERGGAGTSPRPTPLVETIQCAQSHLNPPDTSQCQVCGAPTDRKTVALARRPPLGFLRFDDGKSVEVAGNLLLGRDPAPGASPDERDALRVVIQDPEFSLSRRHAEVRIEGWAVLLLDKGSRNGTSIETLEGLRTLQEGEPCQLRPGQRVLLAGSVGFVFEGRETQPRKSSPEGRSG